MFDHVLLNVSNRKESMKFYTPVLQVFGSTLYTIKINTPATELTASVSGYMNPKTKM
jgi:hypothetical protein